MMVENILFAEVLQHLEISHQQWRVQYGTMRPDEIGVSERIKCLIVDQYRSTQRHEFVRNRR